MQPVFTAVSTSCHAGRGLADHPRCVRVGNGNDKMRLYSPNHSKTTVLPLCARHHSAQRGRSSHSIVPPAPELVRLLKRWWPATYSRSQTLELHSDEKVVQDDHFEIDPLANMPRGLVHDIGSERRVFYIQVAPHQRRFLRFALYCILY